MVFPVMTLESHHHSLFTRQSRADSKVAVSAYTTFSGSTLSAVDLVNSTVLYTYAGLQALRVQPLTFVSAVNVTMQFSPCHLRGVACCCHWSHTLQDSVASLRSLGLRRFRKNTLPLPEMSGKLRTRLFSVCY